MEGDVVKLDEYKRLRLLRGSFVKYLYIPAEGGRLVVGVVEGTASNKPKGRGERS